MNKTILVTLLVLLLIAGNVTLAAFTGSAGTVTTSVLSANHQSQTVAVSAGNGTVFSADTRGTVRAIHGAQKGDSKSFSGKQILSLAAFTGGVAVGFADGTVALLSSKLASLGSRSFDGRIVALTSSGNTLEVAHGYGQYARQFDITAVTLPTLNSLREQSVSGSVTAMNSAAKTFIAGSSTGQVFLFKGGSTPSCTAALNSGVTAIVVAGSDYFVADDGGELSRVTSDCTIVWTTAATSSGARSACVVGSHVLVGDSVGDIAAVDLSGKLLAESRPFDSPIRGIGYASKALIGVPESGNVRSISVSRLGVAVAPWAWVIAGLFDLTALVIIVRHVRRRYPRFARRVSRVGRQIVRNRLAYLFALPALALIGLFFYYPVVDAVRVSFTDTNLASGTSQWVGFANYLQVIVADTHFRRGALNLVIFLVAALIKTFSIPLLCAELVFWMRNHRHRAVYRVLVVLPVVVPDLVVTLLWKTIYQPDGGLLNSLLQAVGLDNLQRVWLGDQNTALFAVIFVGFPFMNAFAFLIFYGGLLQIDQAVFEAASLDGASIWRRLRSIEVPLLRPQARILALFAVIGAIQSIASVFVLTGGGPNFATYVPAVEMYDQIGQGAVAYASTLGVVLALIVLLITMIAQWRPRRRKKTVQ